MKVRMIFAILIILSMLITSVGFAEDGGLFRRNVSKTPDLETEKAGVAMMDFYAPAQASTGELITINNYLLADETASEYGEREYAKPLVSVYIDGTTEWQDHLAGGIVLGAFDAFAGVSLDDGTTWKTTNLSRSADLSSFTGSAPGINQGLPYPGTVHQLVHQVMGDSIFVAWASKYCEGGTPLYTLAATPTTDGEGYRYDDPYLDSLKDMYGLDDVYLVDYFGVAGTQRSVDYTAQGHPSVGEIPYSCIWTMRGKLLAGDDPSTTEVAESTYVIWAKPERLTSGRRDANLPAVDCASGAGCMLTWQEDPNGLRPGQGLGPGEGWSGAVAWQQTDIWYSYISADAFDMVFSADEVFDGGIAMADYALQTDGTMPKSYVPMAMPTRLTDNHMCKTGKGEDNTESEQLPYCFADFSTTPVTLKDTPDTSSTFCADTEQWTNPGGTTLSICVSQDNRLLSGRVGSTRVRLNLKPYDVDADGVSDSAWVVMAAEETKAMGDVLVGDTNGDGECQTDELDCDPIDIGKDVWYYSFDMFDHPIVDQGGILNQPASCKDESEDYCTDGVGFLYDVQFDGRDGDGAPEGGYPYYLTEIARRFALTTNSVSSAMNSSSGLSSMLIYKQGIINQGGPADIMVRRTIVPGDFDPAMDNPYAYENMECAEWAYTDGSNPNYLKGLCLSPAINLSGSTIVECTAGTGNDACAEAFPVADDGSIPEDVDAFPKVLAWRQCDGTGAVDNCELDNDLDDQSWENPYDVAKGHRGFLDGDFVMLMYAWSPNWKANSVGNDHYNLYVRRSFDGGLTWTTTPGELGGLGVTATENYCVNTPAEECAGTEFTYAAGAFEQGRNVSQLIGNKVTVLDPRYTPTGTTKLYPTIKTDWLTANGFSAEGLPYEDDAARDPSKFYMIYETGDNTTVAEGEAVPLDLFYSRATAYGDIWELDEEWLLEKQDVAWRWPWVENDHEILSGEASMLANPGGTFMYAVWNQWEEEILPDGHEHVFNSDMPYRRMLYLPDDSTADYNPLTSILYVSTDMADWETEIVLVGTARDLDRLNNGDTDDDGIVEAKWKDEYTGLEWNERTWKFIPHGFIPGHHDFSFHAKDNEGNWSAPKTVTIWIAEKFYNIYLPTVTR